MDAAIENLTRAAWTIAPELGMVAASSVLILLGSFFRTGPNGAASTGGRILSLTIGLLVLVIPLVGLWMDFEQGIAERAATAAASMSSSDPQPAFVRDSVARLIQGTSLVSGFILLVLLKQRLHARYPAEQIASLLFLVAGVNLVASANDLIALFVALEVVSIPTYIFLYLARSDERSLEATLKYFLLSVFSSAFLLYGFSILYGAAGSTNLDTIRQSLIEPTGIVNGGMLQVALVMIVAGLGFRIASVPFHFYAPDVFEGTSIPAAAMLAVVPKIAGFVALVRLATAVFLADGIDPQAFGVLANYAPAIFGGLALLTMTAGNILALLQDNLRRLLAYSSVAHAGYMLIGLAIPSVAGLENGTRALLFYLLVYCLMTLGVFGVLLLLRVSGRSVETISDLRGLGASSPLAALMMTIFLFGLTGLPPTAGFWGKFNLFVAAWASESLVLRMLAVALALNAAIAAWYYLRLIKSAYLDQQTGDVSAISPHQAPALYGLMGLFAVGAIALFFAPDYIWLTLRGIG